MLVVKQTDPTNEYSQGQNAFTCRSCPYQFLIDHCYFEDRKVKAKKIEDIISEADMWKGANEIEVQCNNTDCDNAQAYYYQRQIRSADEPMTTNFKVSWACEMVHRSAN